VGSTLASKYDLDLFLRFSSLFKALKSDPTKTAGNGPVDHWQSWYKLTGDRWPRDVWPRT
jgi:hypothetical protein